MNTNNGRLNFTVGLDNSRLRQDAEETRRILESIGNSTKSESEKMKQAFDSVGKTIVGVFGVTQATNFVKKVVEVRGEIESLQKSFEVLAGKTAGGNLFAQIKDFAVTTPMGMQELAKGAQTLLSFNTAAEDVMPILRAIGDVSMGNADKFNSLVLAFAQMRSTGKLMGQDLLQMINAGFNPLSVISEQTGKSIGKLKKEMEDGAISADMITKAFMDATSEGGKFHGMLGTMSQGIEGSISNLEGAFEDMLNNIGEKSQGLIVGSIQAAQVLVENYEEIGRIIAELIAVYGVYKAALIALTVAKSVHTSVTKGWTIAELAHYNALLLVEKAQKLLNATILKNPYVLAAAAVAALAYGLYKYFDVENQAKKATDDHNAAIDRLNQKYSEEQNHINSLVETIRSETTARVDRIVAMNELKGLYPDIFAKYIDEKGHIRDLIGLQRELNEEQAKKRMKEEDDTLWDYRTMLSDYKKLLTATEKGWSWATAGTSNNVNNLTEDWSFWQSKESFLKGKIQYWEQMVAKQQKVVDENNYTRFVSSLKDMTDEELENLRKLNEEAETLTASDTRRYEAIKAEIASRKPAEVVKDKTYWEDYKKQQQGMLDAMTEAQLKTKEAEKIRANIALAQEKIDAYSVSKGKKAGEQENAEAVAAADRTRKIGEYTDAVTRAVAQSQFEIEQAEIDALEDSYEKQSRQIDLNYRRLIEENKQRKADWVSELADAKELEWQNANPDYKKKGLVFDRSSVTEADLSADQLAVLKMYEDMANDYKAQENGKLLKNLLDKYATYEAQRTEIAKQYEDQRKQFYELNEDGSYKTNADGSKVLKQGVSQGNIDELNRQEEEALKAVDQQFAMREETFQAWMGEVANLTLEQLKAVLTQAEAELAKLEKSNPNDPKLAQARAKVSTLKDKVSKKNAENNVNPNKRSIKEWNELREALEDCISAFDEIGEAVGGVAGEIISVTGNIMGSTLSMINGIVQLVQMSATGMTATAAAGATAISTIEKASVILAVISAALQIATAIASLFNNDEQKQEEIEALQGRIDQLQWELDNADIMKLRENSINSLELLRKTMSEVTLELALQRIEAGRTGAAFALLFGGAINDTEALIKTTEELAAAYGNVAYTADKALGAERYASSKEQLQKIAEQQMLIQEQIYKEQDKKDTDHGQIEEWEQKIEELGAEAIQLINDMVEDIIGGSATDIAEQLGEAFFEAFEAGEDAAEAWGEKVNDIVGDIMKRMLIQKFLEEPLGEIFNKYKEKWFKDGEFQGIDAVTQSLSGFAQDLNEVGGDFAQIWDALPEEIKNIIGGTTAAREASEKGIATASQESVDELNGRMTAVQSHTYSICESTKQLVQTATLILNSVLNIESNTDAMEARMRNIEDDLGEVKDTMNDIALKGIKLR